MEDASLSLRNSFDRHVVATWLGWKKKVKKKVVPFLQMEKEITEILLQEQQVVS